MTKSAAKDRPVQRLHLATAATCNAQTYSLTTCLLNFYNMCQRHSTSIAEDVTHDHQKEREEEFEDLIRNGTGRCLAPEADCSMLQPCYAAQSRSGKLVVLFVPLIMAFKPLVLPFITPFVVLYMSVILSIMPIVMS